MFQENKARRIFRKTSVSYPLIHARTCAYQGIRNVRFSENMTCFVFLKHQFWDLRFCLIIDDQSCILLLLALSGLTDTILQSCQLEGSCFDCLWRGDKSTWVLNFLIISSLTWTPVLYLLFCLVTHKQKITINSIKILYRVPYISLIQFNVYCGTRVVHVYLSDILGYKHISGTDIHIVRLEKVFALVFSFFPKILPKRSSCFPQKFIKALVALV